MNQIEALKLGAALHDIGKIGVDNSILNNNRKLTTEEYEKLKMHTIYGSEILCPVYGNEISDIALYHHERWDGKGYPYGISGTEIPVLARIIAIIDSFDAMTAERGYNTPKTRGEAILELKRCAGTQFDPDLVQKFIKMLENQTKKFTFITSSSHTPI